MTAGHPSDLCVALAALEAEVEYQIGRGEEVITERIPFMEFHRLPGDQPEKDTHLPENALITGVFIPKNSFGQNNTYLKLREREEYAFALVSVAAALQLNGQTIQSARLASGGVAHKPWRWHQAESYLKGKPATEATFAEAARIVTQDLQPLSGNAYKIPLLQGAVITALQSCTNS